MSRLLNTEEIQRQLQDLPGWSFDADAIHATAKLPTFDSAIDVVVATAKDAESANHHPDIDIRYNKLTFLISTHDAGGVTQKDVELAHQISQNVTHVKGEFVS